MIWLNPKNVDSSYVDCSDLGAYGTGYVHIVIKPDKNCVVEQGRIIIKGLPSRGEMTDAAMAARAECVMLNKGPNVVAGVMALNRLLHRMSEHQRKKTPTLRALHSWEQ